MSSTSEEPLLCENYNNIARYTEDEKFNITYRCSQQIEATATDVMYKYYNGELTETELKNSFHNCCNLYLATLKNVGSDYTSETIKEKAIAHVFTSFQRVNCNCSIEECRTIGKSIASNYEYTGESRDDFVYYDADIYYKNKEIENTLINIVQSMSSAYDLNLDAKEKVLDIQKHTQIHGGLTFNSSWDTYAKYGVNISSMTSIDEEPPKGFRFFFKQNQTSSIADKNGNITLDSQKGILITWSGKTMTKFDVPFNNSTNLGPLAGIFNAAELTNSGEVQHIPSFLSHFNIYTRTYSFINYFI